MNCLLDNSFIRFGTKLYRQIVGSLMGTNCISLVADLFLFCYEGDFMMSLSDDKQADIIDAFNTTSRYLIFETLMIFILTIWWVGYTMQRFNLIKQIQLILDLTSLFLMIPLLPTNIMINVTTLI